jgi:hypothetical protein
MVGWGDSLSREIDFYWVALIRRVSDCLLSELLEWGVTVGC